MHNKNNYTEYKLETKNASFSFFTDNGSIIAENSLANTEKHSHKFYELFYVKKGNVTINNHTLSENTAALIPHEYPHNSISHRNSQRIVVGFTVNKKEVIPFPEDKILILENFEGGDTFKKFARYYYSSYTNKNELIIACLYEIIMLVIEYASTNISKHTTATLSDSDIYRIYLIENYFLDNFQNANLRELAQILHLSTKQTQRIIEKMYGFTFAQYLTNIKMEYAKNLLTDTDLSNSDISGKIGYKSLHHFYSSFKKHFGTTPHKFRKTYKKQ